ncbi:Aerobic cobaltochelatase subunit CobN [Thalassocella blandensis]|nr:Aerobic cobaltochelatase subunit CobN [Thalassocella blandensis]
MTTHSTFYSVRCNFLRACFFRTSLRQFSLIKQPLSRCVFLRVLLFVFCVTQIAHATTIETKGDGKIDENALLMIVSQRNAENIAEAARQFKQAHPDFTILARTDLQLSEYTPSQLSQLISAVDIIFATGLYGPSVAQLEKPLQQRNKKQIIINSDHRLVNLSKFQGHAVFPNSETLTLLAKSSPEKDQQKWLQNIVKNHPQQKQWLTARAYWQAGGEQNTVELIRYLFQQYQLANLSPAPPKPNAPVRWFHHGQYQDSFQDSFPDFSLKHNPSQQDTEQGNQFSGGTPLLAIIDHAGGARPADTRILADLCQRAKEEINHQCVAAVANWGEAGVDALRALQQHTPDLSAIIMLQDFIIGAGEGREAATEILQQLNVPVIKALKLRDRSQIKYQLSSDGIPQDKVYYQVAMPELQGASQPLVVAHAGSIQNDPETGIKVQSIEAYNTGIDAILQRVYRWHALQRKANSDKRIAIVYYNHPPGRHNIGADNLDVPASLWEILKQLKNAGYTTGELPESQEALLNLLQQKGVNLPRDANALQDMSPHINTMESKEYQSWFAGLPDNIQQEMEFGPFGLLHQQLLTAQKNEAEDEAAGLIDHSLEEIHHLLEGLDHPGRDRAVKLLGKLEQCYHANFSPAGLAPSSATDKNTETPANKHHCMSEAPAIIAALQRTGIEGLGGWGPAPGNVMVYQNQLLLPGLQFGNIFIGPQPPRGWEINEELLHANLAFPPPHQYLAFYHFLKDQFKADALVHLGRHSTYEFLPRRSVGLGEDDYSRIIAGDLPGIYPYIVDGVGEGIQAKRRGLAVMVDHLTPPLKSTPLYDELLQLRQLVESFESHHGKDNHAVSERFIKQIREKITTLNLEQELAESMSAELAIMGISFNDVDDDLLVHEIGHYLTTLQERFMPLGLHIYGKPWSEDAQAMMIDSMAPDNATQKQLWQEQLQLSPHAEMKSLLAGLAGQFIAPGPGNDPIRSPQSLPTGRNFYALDSSLIPSRTAWALGKEMAQQARNNNNQNPDKREAVVLWASDVVRDEGVMIAFGLDMLGLEPVWNSRGLVTGLRHQPLQHQRVRRDTVFTTSGLFRDLYGQQMKFLNQATLMALDASRDIIIRDYPALATSLQSALEPLQELSQGGQESLENNEIAAHWVDQTRQLLQEGIINTEAGKIASYRVFGDAPGAYGAGINRMAERSGAWQHRSELAQVYLRRLGHSYGMKEFGKPAHKAFTMQLSAVENTYFGRSSNLYGLIDNNDAFDYLGGLSLAVETLSGQAPENFVIDHSDPQNFKTQALSIALKQEFRGRFLNPEWLQGLMPHGYAGARTMGSEFLEYLWGWQITNPTLVGDWAWEEVKAVYLDDRYNLQLDAFLEQGHNVHVKTNMLAIMLVAINKEFWNADQHTRETLASQFAALVTQHGLPGSGHTDPDHPMLPWLENYLSAEDWQALQQVILDAKPATNSPVEIHRISEINAIAKNNSENTNASPDSAKHTPKQDSTGGDSSVNASAGNQSSENGSSDNKSTAIYWLLLAIVTALLIVGLSMSRAIHQAKRQD